MADKIYPEGVRVFAKHEKAPDYVLATLVITPNDLIAWLKKNESLMTEYDGKKQIRLTILEGSKGPYAVVDDYKSKKAEPKTDDLPF